MEGLGQQSWEEGWLGREGGPEPRISAGLLGGAQKGGGCGRDLASLVPPPRCWELASQYWPLRRTEYDTCTILSAGTKCQGTSIRGTLQIRVCTYRALAATVTVFAEECGTRGTPPRKPTHSAQPSMLDQQEAGVLVILIGSWCSTRTEVKWVCPPKSNPGTTSSGTQGFRMYRDVCGTFLQSSSLPLHGTLEATAEAEEVPSIG